jgi:hypothetical protein
MTAADDLLGIATDLAQVEDMLKWAATEAWWPAGRSLDAPRGRALPANNDPNPDAVAGAKLETGLGDHRAQQAVQVASVHLTVVESRLRVIHAACVLRRQTPARIPVRRPQIEPLVRNIRWFVVTLGSLGKLDLSHTQRRMLAEARSETDRAWRCLDAAMGRTNADPHTHAVAVKDRCGVCSIRPVRLSDSGKAKKDGRCETCAKWWQRNKFERPTSLDAVHAARQAQAARRARGEGWGDESLSCTRPAS